MTHCLGNLVFIWLYRGGRNCDESKGKRSHLEHISFDTVELLVSTAKVGLVRFLYLIQWSSQWFCNKRHATAK